MTRTARRFVLRARRSVFIVALLAVVVAACSGSTGSSGGDTVETAGGSTVPAAAPATSESAADEVPVGSVADEILTVLGEDIQSWGISESSWNCVETGLIEGGYTDGLEDLSLLDAFLLDEDAPLSETPPEFEHFMEGLFFYLFDPQDGCLPPAELTAAQEFLGANPEGPMTYGSDPSLDMLYEGCGAGSLADCDILYLISELGSEYEEFSLICGGQTAPIDPDTGCMVTLQDFSELPDLINQCESGFYAACDALFVVSLIGSPEEDIAASCGGTREPDSSVPCWIAYGMGSR